MRKLLFLFSLLTFVATQAQVSPALQQLQVDVVYLASDYLEGRETGLKGERLAAEYIAWRFEQLGLSPKGEQGNWYHKFDFVFKSNPHASTGEDRVGLNVLGFLDNGADHTVVIGAHYDHLGYGEFSSLYTGEPAIHNGADDNASGVAAMLYLAEQLIENPKAKQSNYLFFGISGEELGLVGSKKWVANPTIDLGTINYMINMDMVGRLNEEKVLAVYGTGTSPTWGEHLESIKVGGLNPTFSESGVGPSDHTSFYLQNIPVLHFFSGQHNHYHKPDDDSERLNYPGIISIADYILAIIERADDEGKLTFTETKNENQDRQAASFKVTLGVMPDYVYGEKGMRIDSVIEGRPGSEAGMKGGDVIIQIGDIEVGDIYDYMEGLGKFEKGQSTTVKIKRDGEEMEMKVTF